MLHLGKFIIGKFIIVVSLLASCSGGSGDGDDGGSNSDAGSRVADAEPPISGDDLVLTCNADSSDFPPYSRSCEVDEDCAIADHQIDCCGSRIATGIAESDLANYEASEAGCRQLFPDCRCVAQPPALDDGTMALNDLDSIGVRCGEAGVCVTFNLEIGGDES